MGVLFDRSHHHVYIRSNHGSGDTVAPNFIDKEIDRLARRVAALTGETMIEAIRKALAERLERERLRCGQSVRLANRLMEIGRHCAALPDIDIRSPDEIVGDTESGTWR